MTLADLLTLFSGRVIGRYTLAQYARNVLIARADRWRWGIGQW